MLMIAAVENKVAAAAAAPVDDAAAALATGVAGGEDDQLLVFVNEWMGAIVDCDVGTLAVQLCGVPRFSDVGREQLRVDLEYLR